MELACKHLGTRLSIMFSIEFYLPGIDGKDREKENTLRCSECLRAGYGIPL